MVPPNIIMVPPNIIMVPEESDKPHKVRTENVKTRGQEEEEEEERTVMDDFYNTSSQEATQFRPKYIKAMSQSNSTHANK